jgi:pimeloyl-ACP methyl ester carboxylesterase
MAETAIDTRMGTVRTPYLEIVYEERGPIDGFSVILPHGFPDDIRAWDEVAVPLVSAGSRVLVPYLRGFGPIRFIDVNTPRTGRQAAIGQDVIDFMDGLELSQVLCTYRSIL